MGPGDDTNGYWMPAPLTMIVDSDALVTLPPIAF